MPEELQTLKISSEDKFGELTRVVKSTYHITTLTLLMRQMLTHLNLEYLKDKLDRRTLSVFPNGQVAEYELNLYGSLSNYYRK